MREENGLHTHLQQMAHQMPVGYMFMIHTLPNGTWALRYGGPEMHRMRQDFGDKIMMIPLRVA